MSAHAYLKARTAAAHAAIDADFSRFDLGCRDAYVSFLLAHARVLPAIEGILVREPALPQWRRRTDLLLEDLRAFDHDLPDPIIEAQGSDLAEKFGLLYVIEGSRLGGHLLSRRVGRGLVVGMTAALAFSRFRLRWATTTYTLALTPVFTPAVIIGMSMLGLAYQTGLWGSYFIIAVAHSLWAFPLVIMVLRVSLDGLDRSIEEAARGMGASPFRVFYEIILPLVAPSILVGALFAFIISINEFIMALFLGTSETETMPRVVYPTLRYRLTPVVAAASGVLMVITIAGLLLAAWLMNLRRLVEYNRSH